MRGRGACLTVTVATARQIILHVEPYPARYPSPFTIDRLIRQLNIPLLSHAAVQNLWLISSSCIEAAAYPSKCARPLTSPSILVIHRIIYPTLLNLWLTLPAVNVLWLILQLCRTPVLSFVLRRTSSLSLQLCNTPGSSLWL